jgi:hypothetical protein
VVKSPRRKLKVFQAQFGFYDTVVAAPSQAAALRAWGTHQNLFASGEAKVTTDDAATAAALQHPETPLRRAVGSKDAFALEPTGLPSLPEAKPKARNRRAPPSKPDKPAKPSADRSGLDDAERALKALDDRRKREEATFRREEEDFQTRQASAQSAYVEARKSATSKVVSARSAYRDAGGVD